LAKKVDLDDLSQIGWFREDDDLMTEVDEILLIERKRLEKVILACDRLKQVNIINGFSKVIFVHEISKNVVTLALLFFLTMF
jgi:hypothetical protein